MRSAISISRSWRRRREIAAVHRRYAQALFDAAKEKGRLQEVHAELSDFAAAVRDVPELRNALRNPELDPGTKAELLDALISGADQLVRNFLRLTAEKGRIAGIEDIARELDRLLAAEERRLSVELTTALQLSDDDARGLVKQIEDASGRKVEVSRKVDPELIGGLILQIGSMRVDASVRGRIERLRRELVSTR
jgi:F-type H+-transporting ATPase subunit delta